MENSNTNHPSHYNQYPIEVIEMMERIFGLEATRVWCLMTAFKYRMRMGHKDDIEQELEKENWYLAKYEELSVREKKKTNDSNTLALIKDAYYHAKDADNLMKTIEHIFRVSKNGTK